MGSLKGRRRANKNIWDQMDDMFDSMSVGMDRTFNAMDKTFNKMDDMFDELDSANGWDTYISTNKTITKIKDRVKRKKRQAPKRRTIQQMIDEKERQQKERVKKVSEYQFNFDGPKRKKRNKKSSSFKLKATWNGTQLFSKVLTFIKHGQWAVKYNPGSKKWFEK